MRELLVQRGGVAAEGVQRCGRDLRLPLVVALVQPAARAPRRTGRGRADRPRCQVGDAGRIPRRVAFRWRAGTLSRPPGSRSASPASAGSSMIGSPRVVTIRMMVARTHAEAADADLLERPRPSTVGQAARGPRSPDAARSRSSWGTTYVGNTRLVCASTPPLVCRRSAGRAPTPRGDPSRPRRPRRSRAPAPPERWSPPAAPALRRHIRGGLHAEPVQSEQRSNNRTGNLCFHLGLLDNPCDLGRDHGSCEPQAHDQLISEPEVCRPVSPLPDSWRRTTNPDRGRPATPPTSPKRCPRSKATMCTKLN